MDPALLQKILAAIADGKDDSGLLAEIIKSVAAEEGAEPPAGADPLAAAGDPPAKDPTKPEVPPMAASKELSPIAKALGCKTEEEAAQAVVKLQKQVAVHAATAAAVELNTRRELIGELVGLGIEKPATAWKGEPKDRNPVDRLMVEDISDMRARVELHKADGPRKPAEAPAPGTEEIQLSKAEIEFCEKNKLTPAQFEARKKGIVRTVGKVS